MTPFGLGVRAIAAYNALRFMYLRVEGLEHLPRRGAALIAARHYHHLFDGSALVYGLPRQPHVFVALDWTESFWERLLMETVCNLADWPVALRNGSFDGKRTSAFSKAEVDRYVRASVSKGAELLCRGELLAIFPEGYPTIDPVRSLKGKDEVLPFARGLTAIVAQAQRRGAPPVPVVPAGFAYRERARGRYDVTLRLGAPVYLEAAQAKERFAADVRERVIALSA